MSKQDALKVDISKINAIAELELAGWPFEPAGNEEIKFCCPVHPDTSPSASLNVAKNLWHCHTAGCDAKGDIITLLAHIRKQPREDVIEFLRDRYDFLPLKVIDLTTVEKYHDQIWNSGPFMTELRKRGISDEDIREARLGFNAGRITIPVFDLKGNCVNIRRYLPGAKGPDKMKNTAGYGQPDRIYMPEQVKKYDLLWLCGGELKAKVAQRLLNPHGVGACSTTCGEGNWDTAFTPEFKGKTIYICYDTDEAGRKSAEKIGMYLRYEAKAIFIIKLPLDPEKYPKGDINDYVGQENATSTQLYELMKAAERWEPPIDADDVEVEAKKVRLSETTRASNMGIPIEFDAVVDAMDTTPYIVPKVVGVSCSKDQPNCHVCPVKPMAFDDKGYVTLSVKGTSVGLLDMINTGKKSQREAIRESLKIPPCKAATFAQREHFNIYDVRLGPQLNIGGEAGEHIIQEAFVVGSIVDLNTPYRLRGRVYPAPRNQQAILLLDGAQQVSDSLTSFTPSAEDLSLLKVFQPKEWTVSAIQAKLDSIYEDLEANVTRIYCRRDLHLAVDLTYHSALVFDFEGRPTKGWMNTLVIGDTAQGKTETTLRYMEHCRVGERIDCKNASAAGLVGGLQQMGNNRWFVSWGVIPKHDSRLVVMEEVRGLSTEVIGRMTDMRSSGIAELPKIEKRRSHARTRLIWLSNSRSDRRMADFNYGIEAISELIGAPEDVRRFDLAVVVSAEQVKASVISDMVLNRPNRPHVYTSHLMHRSVLWAWTRKVSQIAISEGAMIALLKGANHLCSKFSDAMPLVDSGSMRLKLARMAVALAARTFSINGNDAMSLLVRECHVDFIVQWVEKLYNDKTFGYGDYSRAQEHALTIRDGDQVKLRILSSKHANDYIEQMLFTDEITESDIGDWCEVDKDEARREVSFLVRKHCLIRVKRTYVKTASFIELLKSIRGQGGKDGKSGQVDKGAKF